MRTKSQLNKQAKYITFYEFEDGVSFAEHWKLVAESSEFHLTLKRAHRVHFSNSKFAKKRDIISEKRESGMALKSVCLRPKAVLLTRMKQLEKENPLWRPLMGKAERRRRRYRFKK